MKNIDEKKVYESADTAEVNSTSNPDVTDIDDENIPMSKGDACGIVEFEGKRINTCKGEKIVDSGYNNPDKN